MHKRHAIVTCIFSFLLFSGFLSPIAWSESKREILDKARSEKNPDEAIALLEQNVETSAELKPYYLLELARFSASLEKWDKALGWSKAQNMTSLPPSIADEVIYWHGQAYIHAGRQSDALTLFRNRIETGLVKDPRFFLAWFRIASAGHETVTARFDKAFPLLKSTDPESFALSRYLGGLVSVRAGDWKFALQSFTRFSPLYDTLLPDLASWSHYYRAYSLYRLGRYPDALTEFAFYLKTWKDHEYAWQAATNAAVCAVQTDSDALPYAVLAVRLAPTKNDASEAVLFQATILIDSKRYGEAEELLIGIADGRTANGFTPASPRALFMLADISVRQKKNDAAEQRWLSLVSRFPNDPLAEESLYRCGELWYINGDWKAASALFDRYRQSWPSGRFLEIVLWNGGDSHNRSGNPDLAILWWQELIKKFPSGPLAPRSYDELIAAFRKKKEYSSALQAAKDFSSRFPSEARLSDINGEILELNKLLGGDDANTASLYASYEKAKRALTGEGRSIGIRLARQYLADYGKRDAAKTLLLEITARVPRDEKSLSTSDRNTFALAWSLLGNTYREGNEFSSASAAFLRSGNLFSPIDGERSAEALYGALDSFIQSGKKADAKTVVDTLSKTWPDSVWTRRAVVLMSMN